MKIPVLVTGGAGYIGAHVCKCLSKTGHLPISIDNLSTGHAEAVKWGPLELGDINDTRALQQIIRKYRPVAVIHMAASAYVSASVQDPLSYYRNNVAGTLSLLEAMRRAGLKHIVFSSTCATYGDPACALIDEHCPQHPVSPYGRSKLMVETVLADLAAQNKIAHATLRYFNAAGADKEGEIGECHELETHLIPLAIRAAQPNAKPLQVYGSDYPTPDGTAVRDYIHVEDLATGHVAALTRLIAGGSSEFINLGTGHGASVLDIVNSLRQLGVHVNTAKAPRRLGDPPYLVADAAKATELLGWKPRYLCIKDVLATAVAWSVQVGEHRKPTAASKEAPSEPVRSRVRMSNVMRAKAENEVASMRAEQ